MFAPFRMNHQQRARQKLRHESRKIASRAENRPEQAPKDTFSEPALDHFGGFLLACLESCLRNHV